MKFSHLAVVCSLIVLTACKSTVITEEDRALPSADKPQAEKPAEKQQEVPGPEVADALRDSEATERKANLTQSFIAFTGSKGAAISHEGKFNDFEFTFISPVDITEGDVALLIQIESMETDNDGLTKHLLSGDFFDADTYPTASFTSSSITEKGAGLYAIEGDLTIMNTTKPVTLDAEITDTYMLVQYDLDRTEFGVGALGGATSIDPIVPIEAKIVFE